MPCYYPLQATFTIRSDGKKQIKFSNEQAKLFYTGVSLSDLPDAEQRLALPCGRCMGCRLERSRQWAVRIMHESKLYTENCFLTLTFDDEHLVEQCVNGSLDRKHMQSFMKRLRQKFNDRRIRVFYCGEYGDQLQRPHYHLCLFNIDFEDKEYFFKCSGFSYYTSKVVRDLWPFGHNIISDLTFDSAAYVARYCTKKVTGKDAEEYYGDKLPEFAQASLKPGIAAEWLDKFGASDIFSFDECVVNGVKTKPPRFYDKYLEKKNPEGFEKVKTARRAKSLIKEDDNSYDRLRVKEKCMHARMKKVMRKLNEGFD